MYTDRSMDALDLILIGRQLGKIGEQALRGGSSMQMTNGRALVLRDVFANPRSSVSAITSRTGLPQSYVSESIAALSEEGILQTSADPEDRRRTLAAVSPTHRRRVAARASTPVDDALANELGKQRAALVIPLLQRLSELLASDQPGPIIADVRGRHQPRTRDPR
jgi:DNA-binding MarR family transcriptional regulator